MSGFILGIHALKATQVQGREWPGRRRANRRHSL